MENRNANVLVGTIALLLIVALFAFFLWLSKFSGQIRDEYDIFFPQSVAGLTVGSNVSFSGVPIGQVSQIALMPKTPEFVRVRVRISRDVPLLEGTTATLQGVGFTGVVEIQLDGAVKGAPRISEPGPFGVPVIPSKPSGFGQLMETAPQVLDRASTTLARLNEILDDENREAFATALANIDHITRILVDQGPAITQAIQSATDMANAIKTTSDTANTLLATNGQQTFDDLHNTLLATNKTLASINRIAGTTEPGVKALSNETIPQVNQLVDQLSELTAKLDAIVSRIDEDPMGAIMRGRPLPDYAPGKAR